MQFLCKNFHLPKNLFIIKYLQIRYDYELCLPPRYMKKYSHYEKIYIKIITKLKGAISNG